MDNAMGIVFISGAGLHGAIWDGLKNDLKIPVLTVDFADRTKLTFDGYVNRAVTAIADWENHHFILVAHSIGALVGLKVAERFEERLKGFVAIGSVIPKNGQSFASSMPFPQRLILPILLWLFGTKPPKKSIESELCHDLPLDTTANIVNNFTPESKALYTTKIHFDLPGTRRLYIKLTDDKTITTDLQDQMIKNLNATEVKTIHSGHLPMLSKPVELANILNGFMTDITSEQS